MQGGWRCLSRGASSPRIPRPPLPLKRRPRGSCPFPGKAGERSIVITLSLPVGILPIEASGAGRQPGPVGAWTAEAATLPRRPRHESARGQGSEDTRSVGKGLFCSCPAQGRQGADSAGGRKEAPRGRRVTDYTKAGLRHPRSCLQTCAALRHTHSKPRGEEP